MKYCKHGIIDLLLLCDIRALQLIIFQVERFHKVRICAGLFRFFIARCKSFHFFFTLGRFRLFLVHCRSFQVVPCPLPVVLGRFRSFLARYTSIQVVSGRFLLLVGCFRSFFPCCRSFHRSFQVVSCSL